MKLTAADLYELGIIEKVIPEYPVINENNIKRVTLYMKRMICDFMYRYIDMDKEELARQRYNRFSRKITELLYLNRKKEYICHMDTDNTGILLIDGHR